MKKEDTRIKEGGGAREQDPAKEEKPTNNNH